MATGSGQRAIESVQHSSPFSFAAAASSDLPASRLKLHQAIARWMCGEARKAGAAGFEMVFDRAEMAATLGFQLVRVKRSLALLSLSGVLECRADKVVVRDWLRFCGVARIEPEELGMRPVEQIEAERLLIVPHGDGDPTEEAVRTAAGEPACFV